MKKKYSLLFAVLIATVSFAQHQMQGILNNSINETSVNKSFNRSTLRANNSNTTNKPNSLNQGWFNYGRAIELYNSNSSDLNFSYLFPDSMGYVNSGGALFPMGIHQLAELVDFRSTIFSGNPSTAWVGANPTNAFKIDSMSIVYGYTRQHPNPNIVDTLIVTVYDNQTAANLTNNYLTGSPAFYYNTDTVTYKNIGYNQSGNFIAAPTVTTSAQVAPVGQYKFKILLTIADTAIAAFREKAFALPNAFNSVGGKLVVGNVMFKPGYTYTLTQQIDVTANNFIFTSLEENGPQTFPNYFDCNYGSNLCDYSCSYILRRDVRYNMAGKRNYRFSPSYTFSSGYTLEHHLISFHLVDTTTLALTTSQQNVTCSGLNNGVASVSVTSGTPPYTFNWNTSPAQTTQTITGLAPGTYSCVVTDAAANSGTTSVTIQAQIPFITNAISHLINSGASVNFALTANVPCTFSWLAANNSNVTGESLTTQTLSTINDTLINTSSTTTGVFYTIIPTAISGTCAGVPHTLIVAVNPPIIPLIITTSQQNITCNGYNNGVASVSVTSGTPPYTYTWNTSPVQTTQTVTGLPAGTYSCVVNDAAANTATASVNITEPDPIYNVTANVITNGSCVGNATGSAQVSTPMGGTPPYTYMWSTSPPQTTQIVSALANGTYTATVKDSLNCSAQVIVTISPVNTITPPFYDSIQGASCSISQNGFIKLYNGSIITINGNLPFISEFYNGSGNDKAVEIFNPTNNLIDLHSFSYSSYNWVGSLINQSNATYTFPAGSLVQPYGTFVVAHPLANASMLLIANATSSVIDGTSLSLNATTGFPFGTQLVDYAYITNSQTNRRKLTVTAPNTSITPSEWLSYPLTLANLSAHITSTITTYYEANTIIQWDVNANNQTGPSAFNLKAGTYGYTITDTITGCQYANQVIVPSLGLDQFNVNFSANQTLFTAPPFVAQFTNTTPNLSNYNFVWDFGDGTILSSNNASVFHQYQYNGLYTVKLIATAISTLCKDTMIKTDYIFCTGGVSCNLTASITPSTNTNACAGDSTLLTCTNSGSITYQWYLNGSAINGAAASTYYASQSGNYQVAVTNSVCTDFSNQVTITFNALPQAPVVTSSGNLTQCLGGTVVLNAASGYSSYLWSTGATSQSISVNGSGIYSVIGKNAFGCGTTSQPFLLNFSAAPATPICLVTVDTTSLYNQVIWDKPATSAIDSFKIYRETMTNVFSYLNSVAYDSLSIYNDFAANPNVTSYKYKISAIDTCGNETLLSNYHNTIHLQYLGAGNLQWTVYSIENELNPVLYYMVLRDDNSSGNFLPISSTIPGGNSSFTDINFSSYPNAAYRVDVVWNRTCAPAKLINTSTSISRSNVKHVQAPTNLGQIDLSKFVSVYPNPASTSINVRINTTFIDNAMLELYDATGKLIMQQKVVNEYSALNISGLANGIYTVRVITNNEQTIKRIVKQQ